MDDGIERTVLKGPDELRDVALKDLDPIVGEASGPWVELREGEDVRVDLDRDHL